MQQNDSIPSTGKSGSPLSLPRNNVGHWSPTGQTGFMCEKDTDTPLQMEQSLKTYGQGLVVAQGQCHRAEAKLKSGMWQQTRGGRYEL